MVTLKFLIPWARRLLISKKLPVKNKKLMVLYLLTKDSRKTGKDTIFSSIVLTVYFRIWYLYNDHNLTVIK